MAEKIKETEPAEKKPAARKPRKVPPRKQEAPEPAQPAEKDAPAGQKISVAKRELKPTDYVTVRSGFNGRLVYRSSKTGEKFVFSGFGSENDIELQELKKAKNEYKTLFVNNWFLIDDPDVIDYLGVRQYYQNAFAYDEFDSIADMSAEEIRERLKGVSDGQKKTVAYYARKMVADGKIDSMKAISELEKGLGVQLIEH